MIRIRDARGREIPLPAIPKPSFVEVLDTDGKVSVVLYADPLHAGTLVSILHGTPEAKTYTKLTGAEFVPIQQVDLRKMLE